MRVFQPRDLLRHMDLILNEFRNRDGGLAPLDPPDETYDHAMSRVSGDSEADHRLAICGLIVLAYDEQYSHFAGGFAFSRVLELSSKKAKMCLNRTEENNI
jgi:hypothetical protein